jgi:D-glutamate N-acetyltransferase
MQLNKPYLLFLGASESLLDCKTAAGLRDWCRPDVTGQSGLPGCKVDLGLPWYSAQQARDAGARSFVIGVAPVGGAIPLEWHPALLAAVAAGLDVVSGMHTRLAAVPGLAERAAARGCRLLDVRHSDRVFSAATGERRAGRRVLTVGTDCALGKKYTALALTAALRARGAAATFRATGQTGIMIAGAGVAIDAVVADFIAGAAEWLSPANDPAHWDVIEGQGALFHPAYAGVTLGLVHGSQPDALVLCHDPARRTIDGYPHHPIPSLAEAMSQYLTAARVTNREARFVGISLNTSSLGAPERERLMAALAGEFGLPVIDPMQGGAGAIAARLAAEFGAT